MSTDFAHALLPACGSADDPAGGDDVVDVTVVTPEVAVPTDTPAPVDRRAHRDVRPHGAAVACGCKGPCRGSPVRAGVPPDAD